MKRLSYPTLAATAFGLLALAASSAAQARSDVYFSIGLGAQPVYTQPAPVYVQPAPVYVQPRPVYVQPQPVYVQPQPVYVQPQYGYYGQNRRGPWGDRDGDGVPNAYDRDGHGHHWNHHRGPRGDRDRDGVPNNRDRFPENRYRY